VSAPLKTRLIDALAPRPSLDQVRTAMLDAAFAELEARPGRAGGIDALDAGCGHSSPLRRYRARLGTLTGADLHEPAPGSMPYLDRFISTDLCRDSEALAPGSVDVALSNFTLEHFADPGAALANIARSLRPGGHLIVTTVNRRHPFVGAYLALPQRLRDLLQRAVRANHGHSLVGACNDPSVVRAELRHAGLQDPRVETVGHLARAWRRHWLTLLLGLLGDLAAAPFPGRRSTIVASARMPSR
jgi:SAM-dependent methyltransferase